VESEPLSKYNAENQHFLSVDEVDSKLWRDFPGAGLERVLGGETNQRFGTVRITIFNTWRDVKLLAINPIGERHGIHRKIGIAECMLGKHTDTKRLVQISFVTNPQGRGIFTPPCMGSPHKKRQDVLMIPMGTIMSRGRFMFT
jgi:hypothetical protein